MPHFRSEADKFHDFARRLTNQFNKFTANRSHRMKRQIDAKRWWLLETAADKRFVTKIIRMVEDFEL